MLPEIPRTERDLELLRRDPARWRQALEVLASRHGLAGPPVPAETGSLPVFAFRSVVAKLYAPDSAWRPGADAGRFTDLEVERAHLERLEGRLPVPTPRVVGEGELGAWRYLLLERLEGVPLESALDEVGRRALLAAAARLGESVRALHEVPHAGLPARIDDFDRFLDAQVRTAARTEEQRGAPAEWVRRIDPFVRSVERGLRGPVLLHTELGPGHVLAEARGGEIRLTGMIDFVDAMAGDPEYDLAAVAFFVTAGDGEALGACLDGYGWAGPRGEELARRLLRYLLLHRFAPLRWLLERRPPGAVTSFEQLAPVWMGSAPPTAPG